MGMLCDPLDNFDIFYYTMEDKPAIVNFLLSNFYIKENEALANQLCLRNRQIAEYTAHIDSLVEGIAYLQEELERVQRPSRVLIDTNGSPALFRRRADGVYYEEQREESPSSVARRLNFDFDDDDDDTELMDRLMFGTP
jgi:hypothetical protein